MFKKLRDSTFWEGCYCFQFSSIFAQIPVPGKENLPSQPTSDAPQPPTIETPRLEEKLVKESATPSAALDQRRPPLTNLQKLSRSYNIDFESFAGYLDLA